MEQNNSSSKRAGKFQASAEATDKLTGTFQSGKLIEKVKVSEILPGENRGSGHTDVQFGLPVVQIISETGYKPNETLDPEQQGHFADDFSRSNPHAHQESAPKNKSRVIGVSYDTAVDTYPHHAKIVAPLRGMCTRSLMLIHRENVMIDITHDADLQHEGNVQHEAPFQDETTVKPFVKNMESEVPTELIKIGN